MFLQHRRRFQTRLTIQMMYHNIWLGSKLNQSEHLELDIENMFENSNDKCLQIQPRTNKLEKVDCAQLNLPLCQRTMDWTVEDIIRKMTENQNSIAALSAILNATNHASIAALSSSLIPIENAIKEITVNHDSIVALSTRLTPIEDTIRKVSPIPIGFIYIQYVHQISPSDLWPTMKWTDVTSMYAGQFFRALGGDSAAWGKVQTSCAPKIMKIESVNNITGFTLMNLPTDGWSDKLFTGKWEHPHTAIKVFMEGCEVRPINSAVRIWRRFL